jgi:tetratricopeptide (TPR) repeat protein
MTVKRWAILAAMLALSSCAHWKPPADELARLIDSGQLLTAREAAQTRLNASPDDAGAKAALVALGAKISALSENDDFNPIKYLYAQAYIDYHDRKKYASAVRRLAHILDYSMDNPEIVDFLEKAKDLAELERAATASAVAQENARAQSFFGSGQFGPALAAARAALKLDPQDASAQGWAARARQAMTPQAVAAIEPPRLPTEAPDPEELETHYEEAVKAYLRGDLAASRDFLLENVRLDPGRPKWRKTLRRIQNEMPR